MSSDIEGKQGSGGLSTTYRRRVQLNWSLYPARSIWLSLGRRVDLAAIATAEATLTASATGGSEILLSR